MEIKIKKLHDNAKVPTKAHPTDAGFDLYACLGNNIYIYPHETIMIPIGFAWEIPEGYFGAVFARSGLATKQGLRPANCVGVIDSDYRGEIIVAVHNDSGINRTISNGDRIAQLVIMPYLAVNFVEVDDLADTDRGKNGFGSTGVSATSYSEVVDVSDKYQQLTFDDILLEAGY